VPVIMGFTPFLWFRAPYIVNGNDTSWPFNASEWFYSRLFMWYPRDNGGGNAGFAPAGLLWHGGQALTEKLHLSHTLDQKLFFTVWYVIAALSMYTSVRILTRSRAASFVATVLYLFNPVIITGALFENASVANIALYSALPSLVTILILTLQGRMSLRTGAPLFGLVSFVTSPVGMDPPLQIAMVVVFAAIVLVMWLTDTERRTSRRFITVCAVFGLAFIAVNAYWIIPLAQFLGSSASEFGGISLSDFNFSDWEAAQSSHSALFTVARMLGSWDWFYKYNGEWYVSYAQVYLRNPVFIALGAALVAMAFSCLRLMKSGFLRRYALVLCVTGIVILLFAPGSHPPNGIAFRWLRDVLPGFQVIRSPWFVFAQFLPLVYGMLLGIFVAQLKTFNRRVAACAVLSVMALAYGYPVITGEFFKPFREQNPGFVIKYPTYV